MKPTNFFSAIIVFILFSACTRIEAGHEGILVKQYGTAKGVQDVSLVTGRVTYNPFNEDVYEFPIFVQTADFEAFKANAIDGSEFGIDPTISFRVLPGKSPQIFKKYRKPLDEITATTLLGYIKNAYRIQFNLFTTDQLISQREKFETAVENSIQKTFEKEGFFLEQLTSGLQYPQSIVEAVNAKNKAIQETMQARNQLIKDSIDAQRKIIQARADKEANELRNQALTPLLIQQKFIEKWDGSTPLYGQAPLLMQNIK